MSSKGSLFDSLSTFVVCLEKITFFGNVLDVAVVDVVEEVRDDDDEVEVGFCLLGRKYITVLPAVVTNSSKPKTVFLTELLLGKLSLFDLF